MTRKPWIHRCYFARRIAVAAYALACALHGAAAQSPDSPKNQSEATADAAAAKPAQARFELQVQAPSALQAMLLKHMDLQRFRHLADLDALELTRLLEAAPQNARDLLATQGFFAPRIEIEHDSEARSDAPLGLVRIHVEPGGATQVHSADVYWRGDIADAADAGQQREAAQRQLRQQVGKAFSQSEWSAAKTRALRELTVLRYPRAQVVNSLSDIDAQAGQAHWHLELDSGERVRIGDVRVEGGTRYDPAIVVRRVRLAGLDVGADYSLSQLQDAQQQIASSPYFTSVYAYADLDPAAADAQGRVPVVVKVSEALPQKVVLGVGGSTDSGARLSFEHSHLRVPGIDWRARQVLKLQGNDQSLRSDWQAPIDDKGWHWLVSGSWTRQVDATTTTRGLRLSAGRSQESAALDRRYYLQLDRARTNNSASVIASSQGNETALSANLGWTWRRFDNIPYPDTGYGLGLNVGVGTTLNPTRVPFATAHARWLTYWPLGERVARDDGERPGIESEKPKRSANGRLALRLEGGAVLTRASAPIPDTLLYLAGGDNSVRGYGLRDIGVILADGSVAAGRYLMVSSLEWQRPITAKGERTDWESVVFVDAGAVSNELSHLQAQVGVGVGARYNSPVGPVQMDLAYGVSVKRFRLHLSVGFAF